MKHEAPSTERIEVVASGFAALGSEQRLMVLRRLVRAGAKGMTIGTLGSDVGLSGATLTHHIQSLSNAGLVRRVKEGRSIRVMTDYAQVRALSDYLLAECCADHEGHDHD